MSIRQVHSKHSGPQNPIRQVNYLGLHKGNRMYSQCVSCACIILQLIHNYWCICKLFAFNLELTSAILPVSIDPLNTANAFTVWPFPGDTYKSRELHSESFTCTLGDDAHMQYLHLHAKCVLFIQNTAAIDLLQDLSFSLALYLYCGNIPCLQVICT